jgi:hypothetical protein
MVVVALSLAACAGPLDRDAQAPPPGRAAMASPASPAASTATTQTSPSTQSPAQVALRAGERFVDLPLPAGSYSPAPTNGTDDYRCFLLDPGLGADAFLTGATFTPGDPALVHHAILYRIPPADLRAAQTADAASPGSGWTCFGGTGLSGQRTVEDLDSAPWLSAWAPGAGEQVFGSGVGVQLAAGTRIALQVHYHVSRRGGADTSRVRLRLAPRTAKLAPLSTMLLAAPVELPCPAAERGPLCDRGTALLDLTHRFGAASGRTPHALQLLCGGDLLRPRAGPVQRCDRPVRQPATVRAAAGHMHLLGRSIRIELNPGTPRARVLLDRRVWNFDDQRATPLETPVRMRAGDVLRVTCTHDAALRRQLPDLRREPPRYVLWGEGTADEMCLGILSTTRR